MEIIKPGTKKQKSWSKKCTCTGAGNGKGGCGAVLLVTKEDLFKTYSYHYDGSSETYTTFECLQCKCLTDIKDYDGPTVNRVKGQNN